MGDDELLMSDNDELMRDTCELMGDDEMLAGGHWQSSDRERERVVERVEDKVDRGFSAMQAALGAHASMLGALLQGEDDCPRSIMIVPKPPADSRLRRARSWLKPKNWINQEVILFFVCPLTKRAVGEGFVLRMPKDWVTRYGPAIRVGLTLLKIAFAVGHVASVDANGGFRRLTEGVDANRQGALRSQHARNLPLELGRSLTDERCVVDQTVLWRFVFGLQRAEKRLFGAQNLHSRRRVLGEAHERTGVRDETRADELTLLIIV